MASSGHPRFRRFGRSWHLQITTADDLRHVLDLHEALWVASGAPIATMNCDPTFLALVDSDHNGRIMCFELKDAIGYLLDNLKDLSGVTQGSNSLLLDAINTNSQQGKATELTATKMLQRLGCLDVGQITLDQVRQIKDKPIGPQATATASEVELVEKLILYQRYIMILANNFVSFPHLYDPASRAMFEMGTLVMDGREFNMSLKVKDRALHSQIAATSNMYVLYIEVACKQDGQNGPLTPEGPDSQNDQNDQDDGKYELAVPVTSGGKGNLRITKRGVFHDRNGRELDATVVQIIENPISVTEAVINPFVRLGRLLSGKIQAITGTAEKQLDTAATKLVQQIPKSPAAAAAGKPGAGMMAGGMLMGGGIALAAVLAAAMKVVETLKGVAWYRTVIGLAVAILAVMLPTIISAVMKLRSRDLGAILEGSGWAINAQMRLTFKQGRVFTHRPKRPGCTIGLLGKVLYLVGGGIVAAGIGALAWYLGQR